MPHNKRFFVEVDLNGRPVGSGSGHSKKEAEQKAARLAWQRKDEWVARLANG